VGLLAASANPLPNPHFFLPFSSLPSPPLNISTHTHTHTQTHTHTHTEHTDRLIAHTKRHGLPFATAVALPLSPARPSGPPCRPPPRRPQHEHTHRPQRDHFSQQHNGDWCCFRFAFCACWGSFINSNSGSSRTNKDTHWNPKRVLIPVSINKIHTLSLFDIFFVIFCPISISPSPFLFFFFFHFYIVSLFLSLSFFRHVFFSLGKALILFRSHSIVCRTITHSYTCATPFC